MKGIKMSPFMIFLIILVILVILVVLYNSFSNKEGLINFRRNTNELDTAFIDMYSPTKSVIKLYDNLFFDNKNGNLIEIVEENSTTKDLVSIYVTNREGVFTKYVNSPFLEIQESNTPNVSSSYSSWVYVTKNDNTGRYSVMYIPWMTETYIHIIDNDNPKEMKTYMFSDNNNFNYSKTSVPSVLNSFVNDNDISNNKMTIDRVYNSTKEVYQISKNIRYDLSNSNLIVNTESDMTVYTKTFEKEVFDLNRTSKGKTSSTLGSGAFTPWTAFDGSGQRIILSIPFANRYLAATIRFPAANQYTSYTLGNVCRFKNNAIDDNNGSARIIESKEDTTKANQNTRNRGGHNMARGGSQGINISFDETNPSITIPLNNNAISDYFNMFMNTGMPMGMPPSSVPSTSFDSNYILKTQIVPPVCPSCPACAGGGASSICTNCGGQGGSGTLTCNGTSLIDASGNVIKDSAGKPVSCNLPAGTVVSGSSTSAGGVANNLITTTGSVLKDTGSGATGLIKDTVKETKGLLENTGKGATGLLKDTATGTTGLLKDTASGATGLLKETVSGTKDILKDTVTGTKDFLKDTGSGLSKFLTANKTNLQQQQQQQGALGGGATVGAIGSQNRMNYGTNTQYTDPYSYYGNLPARASTNYLPVTADFSAFGR